MNILFLIFTFILNFIRGLMGGNASLPLLPTEEQIAEQKAQLAWSDYYLLNSLRGSLRAYHYEEATYPETIQAMDPDYITFEPDFDFTAVTYTLDEDKENYSLCLKTPTPEGEEKNTCVTKETFLPAVALTPDLYALDKPLDDELFMSIWDDLKSAQGDQIQLEEALMAIAYWHNQQPESTEFLTLYAQYLLEDGHLYSDKYYPETLEIVEGLTKKAAEQDPDDLFVLLHEENIAWQNNQTNLAIAKQNRYRKLYGDMDLVKIYTSFKMLSNERLTYLEEYLTRADRVHLEKAAYYNLLNEYYGQNKDEKIVETYERMIARFNHPWDYQGLGLYWLSEKQDCEKAIEIFNKGLEVSEIGMIRHSNLPQAYAVCAEKYAADEDYTKAIEYMQIAVDNNIDLPDCECQADYLSALGDYYVRRGFSQTKDIADFEKAFPLYDQAAEENPARATEYAAKKRQANTSMNVIKKEINY